MCSLGYGMANALWINMDETAIKYHYAKIRGYKARTSSPELKQKMVDRASHRDAKSHCTLVSTIATDPVAQQSMPQFFTPNTKGRKQVWRAAKKKNTHPNVRIHLDSTGWMTISTMKMYLDILAKVVKHLGHEKVVLVMDCHTAHMAIEVLKKIAKLKWKVLLIPSKLTWLLQPLDVNLFAALKSSLYRAHVENQINSTTGQVKFEQWSTTMLARVHSMLEAADGKNMFEKCGFDIPTHTMPKKILPCLSLGDLGCVRKLTIDELTSYMGIRGDAHHGLLFKENIPHDRQHHKLILCTPTHRLRLKRSLSSFML